MVSGAPAQSPVVLRGAITYTGREMIMQDQTGAIAVENTGGAALSLGDEVEVRGRLKMRQDSADHECHGTIPLGRLYPPASRHHA